VQGERELAKDCRTLGRFQLRGIPALPAGMARIAVRFALDADGVLAVTAKEESTGVSAHIEIQPMNGLTDGQVEAMLKSSYDNAVADFDARRVADLKVELGIMLRAIDKNLPSFRSELDPETLADIQDARRAAETARAGEPKATEIQKVRDALERASLPLSALMMDRVAKDALSGKKLGDF
jgi:molecular chaperone HscA